MILISCSKCFAYVDITKLSFTSNVIELRCRLRWRLAKCLWVNWSLSYLILEGPLLLLRQRYLIILRLSLWLTESICITLFSFWRSERYCTLLDQSTAHIMHGTWLRCLRFISLFVEPQLEIVIIKDLLVTCIIFLTLANVSNYRCILGSVLIRSQTLFLQSRALWLILKICFYS